MDEEDAERAISLNSIPGIQKIFNFVNNQQLASWQKKGIAAEDVFVKLKLNKAGEKLLENPKFLSWVKYVDDYNIKNPDKETAMIPTLTAHYGDEVLAKMLEAAKKWIGPKASPRTCKLSR